MQDVHAVGLLVRVKGRAQRVDDPFHQALAHAQGEHAAVDQQEAGIGVEGRDRARGPRSQENGQDRVNVPQKGDVQEPAHAQEVDQRAAQDDGQGVAPESRAQQDSGLLLGDVQIGG